jgi:hypothetical protein
MELEPNIVALIFIIHDYYHQCHAPVDHLMPTLLVTESYNWNFFGENWKLATTVYYFGAFTFTQLLKSPVTMGLLIHMCG